MLSADDRDWLEAKFTRLHERIDAVEQSVSKKGSDIHNIEGQIVRLQFEKCQDIKDHEDRCHNPAKTWGILSSIVAVAVGLLEGLKWFLKRGGA